MDGQLSDKTKRVLVRSLVIETENLRSRILHEGDGRQGMRVGIIRRFYQRLVGVLRKVAKMRRVLNLYLGLTFNTRSRIDSSGAWASLRMARIVAIRTLSSAVDHKPKHA
jgi:hypothetical protein